MRIFFVFLIIGICTANGEGEDRSSMRTPNFIVDASSGELAKSVARQAEIHRREIAIRWLGRELPQWKTPCLLFVSEEEKVWAWTYHYKGEVRGIAVRGNQHNILTHSLPHEVAHAVLISHFQRELPRWIDEGIAVSCELDCPARLCGKCGKQPLNELFAQTNYPEDWEPFYGQSYSVTKFLIDIYGRQSFLQFFLDSSQMGWEGASRRNFQLTVTELDTHWRNWYNELPALYFVNNNGK